MVDIQSDQSLREFQGDGGKQLHVIFLSVVNDDDDVRLV